MALGDTLFRIAALEDADRRSKLLEAENAREQDQDQYTRKLKQFALRRVMAQDLVRRARNEGLSGDALTARVGELFPAYQGVYSQTGDPWNDATPDAILALGMDTEAEDEARKARLIEQAKYGVRDQYGDTPIDQASLRDRSELMNDQRDQQNRLAFEDYTSKLRRGDDEYKSKMRREEAELEATLRGRESSAGGMPKLTEAQEKSRLFADLGRQGFNAMREIIGSGYDPASKVRGNIDRMSAGTGLANMLASPKGQQWKSAANNVVSSLLYKKSGAQAPASEIEAQSSIYIPMPGDDPETVKRKMDFIEGALSSLEEGVPGGSGGSGGRKPLPPGFVELPDGRVRGPDGRMYRRAGM